MNKGSKRAITWLIFIMVFLSFSCAKDESASEINKFQKKNVILIVVDALRADRLGCYGYPKPTTPNIDEFASKSLVFQNAISAGRCTYIGVPSLITSRLPIWDAQLGKRNENLFGLGRFFPENVEGDYSHKLPNMLTVAKHFQNNGYHTSAFLSNPHLRKENNFNQGCDLFQDYSHIKGKWADAKTIVNDAKQYIDQGEWKTKGKFFMWLHFMEPHTPYIPEKRFDVFSKGMAPTINEVDLNNMWWLEKVSKNDLRIFKENLDYMSARYDDCILMVDHYLGELFNHLEKNNFYENTAIVLTADHGEEFFEHGRTAHNNYGYGELVHIPLIVMDKGNKKSGKKIKEMVRNYDVFPTACGLTGLDVPNNIEGVNLFPAIRGSQAYPQIAYSSDNRHEVLIKDRWKTFRFSETPGGPFTKYALYDLKKDPNEKINLYEKKGKKLKEMLAGMSHLHDGILMKKGNDYEQKKHLPAMSEELKNNLKSLGYLQ